MVKKLNLIIILFCWTLTPNLSFAQRGEAQPLTLKKITGNLYEVLGGRGSNSGAYIGDNGVLLIDAKMDETTVDNLLTELKKITDKPVTHIVNTHSDGDHVNGNQFYPQDVTIIAHRNCREEFFHPRRDGTPSVWKDPKLAPFLPSLTFQRRMDIYLGSKKVELRYFGVGHTKGDIVVYIPEAKTAFLGDQIFIGRPQLIHDYKGGNSQTWVKTVTNILKSVKADKFCSGHGELADRNTVEAQLELMKTRHTKVRSLIDEGKTLEQVQAAFSQDEARLIGVIYKELGSPD